MILNLIDSLVDEKQLDNNNDENLLLTIDCLINNLKHLRDKIQTIHHDDTHPLNLSKPKVKHQTQTTVTQSFPSTSSLFPSQPFFPPFSGKSFVVLFRGEEHFISSSEYGSFTKLLKTISCISSQ
jgi:hypothetical protein